MKRKQAKQRKIRPTHARTYTRVHTDSIILFATSMVCLWSMTQSMLAETRLVLIVVTATVIPILIFNQSNV